MDRFLPVRANWKRAIKDSSKRMLGRTALGTTKKLWENWNGLRVELQASNGLEQLGIMLMPAGIRGFHSERASAFSCSYSPRS